MLVNFLLNFLLIKMQSSLDHWLSKKRQRYFYHFLYYTIRLWWFDLKLSWESVSINCLLWTLTYNKNITDERFLHGIQSHFLEANFYQVTYDPEIQSSKKWGFPALHCPSFSSPQSVRKLPERDCHNT